MLAIADPPSCPPRLTESRTADAARRRAEIERLYVQCRKRLLRMFNRKRIGNEDGRDLLHATFVRMLQAESADAWVSGEAYAFATAMSVMKDARRRERTRRRMLKGIHDENDAVDALTPEHILEAREALCSCLAIIDEMSEHGRRALLQRRLGGEPYERIAEALGTTISGVEKLLVRRHNHLVRALGPWTPVEPSGGCRFYRRPASRETDDTLDETAPQSAAE